MHQNAEISTKTLNLSLFLGGGGTSGASEPNLGSRSKVYFKENLIILVGLGITVDTFKLNSVIKVYKVNILVVRYTVSSAQLMESMAKQPIL